MRKRVYSFKVLIIVELSEEIQDSVLFMFENFRNKILHTKNLGNIEIHVTCLFLLKPCRACSNLNEDLYITNESACFFSRIFE